MGNELQLQNITLQAMHGTSLQGIAQQQLYGINLGNGISIGNILAGISDVENIGSSNTEQKVSGIQNLISKALDIVSKLGSAESAAAKAETAKKSKDTAKTNQEIEEQKNELTQKFEQIGSDINQESDVIKAAQGEIETANQKLEEAKKDIEEKQKSIEEKKEQLKTEKNVTKQRELLKAIQQDSDSIKSSSDIIKSAQEVIKCASQEVADSVAIIEELNGGAFELQQEGENKVAKLSQEAANNAQKNAQTQGKGVENQIVGEQLQRTAQATSSTLFGVGSAPQLYRAAIDNKQAGTERQTGAATNLNAIKQGIGGLNDNVSLLNNFSTSIGGAFTEYADCIGDWNKALEPAITGFGTIMDNAGSYSAMADTLKTATEADIKKLDGTQPKREDNKNYVEQPTENNNSQSNMQFQQSAQYIPDMMKSGDNQNTNDLETLKVNTKLEM